MNPLSSLNRPASLYELSESTFDVLIIGGGITGAGIALDAASRGFKTALIEKQDFAEGTSSRSTKLIHGGLRYLKNYEFALVMEVAKERKVIFRNAPHLVSREKLLLPLIKGGSFNKLMTSVGLTFYDLFARVNFNEWHKILSREDTIKEEPLLKSELLSGSGFYSEYRSDDARLTIEVLKTAVKYGAHAINYMKAADFIFNNESISGVEADDFFSGRKISIKARQIINAAGPWVDEIRQKDKGNSQGGKRLHLTKGVHIVVAWQRFPLRHSVYFDVDDGRMIFAIPRGKTTYIGTTDTNYSGELEHPLASMKDVEYLMKAVNRIFPAVKLEVADVLSSWAGLRPLIHEEGKSPSELSRKDEIFISHTGLISIAGGKLSGYRKMAEKAVDLISKKLKRKARCSTKAIMINGGEFLNAKEVNEYFYSIMAKVKPFGLDRFYAENLVGMYGKQCDEILKKFMSLQAEYPEKESHVNLARAELWFSLNCESVFKAQDFFVRRTAKLLFEPWSVKSLLPFIIDDMKKFFGWTDERAEAEKNEMEVLLIQSVTFS